MNDWMENFAAALDVPPLSQQEVGAVLKLARDVAHGVERKFAPLCTYLLGVAVGAGTAPDAPREETFHRAVEAARSTVTAPPGDVG